MLTVYGNTQKITIDLHEFRMNLVPSSHLSPALQKQMIWFLLRWIHATNFFHSSELETQIHLSIKFKFQNQFPVLQHSLMKQNYLGPVQEGQ